jgi:hypothetical protein
MRLTTRPARPEDIRRFYPEQTASFRAWVAELDGEPAGIIGIALTRPVAGAFSKADEALKPHLRHPAILRLIKRTEAAIKASRVPVLAIAEPGEPKAPAMLQRVGARPLGQFDGQDYYGWGF